MVASVTKRKRNEIDEEEGTMPLIRKIQKVSQGQEQSVEPSKNAAKNKKQENTEKVDNSESSIAATSFDCIAEKLVGKKAKLRKEMKVVRKDAKRMAAAASSRETCEEAWVEEKRNVEKPLQPNPQADQAAKEFERKLMEEEMIEKASGEFDKVILHLRIWI